MFYHWDNLNAPAQKQEVVEIRTEPPRLLQFFPRGFTKILTPNDVSKLVDGMELSLDQVHNHIFKHLDLTLHINKDIVPIIALDLDTGINVRLILRKRDGKFLVCWGWYKDFVRRRGLEAGMSIRMYWDVKSKSLVFSLI